MLKLELLQPGEAARQTGRQKQGGGGEKPGIVRSNFSSKFYFPNGRFTRAHAVSYLSTYLLTLRGMGHYNAMLLYLSLVL